MMALSWLPSIPYPSPRPAEGFWAPVTSTLNWCEEDYYATKYSAEIVNTLTNLLLLSLGLKGIRNCLNYGHDSVFIVSFIGLCLVGLGSVLFHSTLKYPMQLVDELSMIYTGCLMVYATFSYSASRAFRHTLAWSLAGLAVFITLYYHYLQDPLFHQTAFGLLTVTIVVRCIHIMESDVRPYLRSKYGPSSAKAGDNAEVKIDPTTGNRVDQQLMMDMWCLVSCGISLFLGGWAIWAMDIAYCSSLRHWRRQIGLPWGMLLEGHGWWHIMTGIGSYFYITWGIWLRRCLDHQEEDYVLHWPNVWTSLPQVVYTTAMAGQLIAVDGHAALSQGKVVDAKLS